MDFQELLHAADRNKAEASYEASVKRFSTDLPPPKKVSKNGVMSDNIAKFLAKRKAEEAAKAEEARRQKEKLLALRAQSSKNNKKAKIMASRTKDNDFSKIKLTEDEIEAKRKREAAILRQNLSNKVERMKARIELEEKEKLLPKKRKRKSKEAAGECDAHDDHDGLDASPEHHRLSGDAKQENHSKSHSEKNNSGVRKPSKPAAPPISFHDLLKVAEKKQFEPLEVAPKKKEEEKPLTKKEKKLLMEERERERRKKERMMMGDLAASKPSNQKEVRKKPVVIHVAKDNSKPTQQAGKSNQKPVSQIKPKPSVEPSSKSIKSSVNVSAKSNHVPEQRRDDRTSKSNQDPEQRRDNRTIPVKKASTKSHESKNHSQVPPPVPQIDEEAIAAAIEKRLREKMEKEIEQKLMSKFGLLNGSSSNMEPSSKAAASKAPSTARPPAVKKELLVNDRGPMSKSMMEAKMEQFMAMKRQAMEQRKRAAQRQPEKRPFNFNPYMDPPKRLLEPQIRRPPPRRIESDDDDEDDDDLSDFIDDGPATQNEENYSEYIKEIFGYDKNKYLDDDDDVEAMESSFAQQMKEELESAKAGIREDLEEERKELERKKRKKLKKK